jgi:hypothetical protein
MVAASFLRSFPWNLEGARMYSKYTVPSHSWRLMSPTVTSTRHGFLSERFVRPPIRPSVRPSLHVAIFIRSAGTMPAFWLEIRERLNFASVADVSSFTSSRCQSFTICRRPRHAFKKSSSTSRPSRKHLSSSPVFWQAQGAATLSPVGRLRCCDPRGCCPSPPLASLKELAPGPVKSKHHHLFVLSI